MITTINNSNISSGWLSAFDMLLTRGVQSVTPLAVVMNFTEESMIVNVRLQEGLDKALLADGHYACNTTANTIFPRSLWVPGKGRIDFYDRYQRITSRLKQADPRNRYGLYFARLISYRSAYEGETVNQLERIILTFKRGNTRRSSLQATVFDPLYDLNDQRQRGFPCLQHVFFTPNIQDKTLSITGIYATQHIFERAFGNYLGLYRLGNFMAHEMELRLNQVICFASQAKLGCIGKQQGRMLLKSLQQL